LSITAANTRRQALLVPLESIVVEAGRGRTFSFLGYEATFKISGEQTSNGLSLAEFVAHPGTFTPPHTHKNTDEVSYIVAGEMGFMVAEEEFVARAGAYVVRPRGVPHAFWNIADTACRFIDMYTPAGFEAWFEEIARMTASPQPPTFQELAAAAARHDVFVLPGMIPALVEKYGIPFKMPGLGA
jgi:quercetin dioxygenase-like cupin family protein